MGINAKTANKLVVMILDSIATPFGPRPFNYILFDDYLMYTGWGGWTRTSNGRGNNPVHLPVALHPKVVGRPGLEPGTCGLKVRCSTN